MSESDGLEEALEGQLRVALTVAGRTAEEIARWREQAARDAEARSLQATREMEQRLAAERAMAVAALAPLDRDRWWDRATSEEVGAAWQTARTWQDVEPAARRAAETIREQVQDRHGIDVEDLRPDPGALEQALRDRTTAAQAGDQATTATARAEDAAAFLLAASERYEADRDTTQSTDPAAGDELTTALATAGTATADAGRASSTAEQARASTTTATDAATEPAYDSLERRAFLAEALRANGADTEAVEARMLTEVGNAQPPAAAASAQLRGQRDGRRARRGLGRVSQPSLER